MNLQCILVFCCVCIAAVYSYGTNDALTYLSQFNYLSQTDMSSGQLRSQDSVNEAIRLFQRNNGLEVTGIINDEVRQLMQMPRCGLPDNTGTEAVGRARRYALSDIKWAKKQLTWKIDNWTHDLRNTNVREIIGNALKHWSDASQLSFTEVHSGNADIIVRFERNSHGDGNPFDGIGNVLAHAFFPSRDTSYGIAGDAHFDDDEQFTDGTHSGTNLFQVAVHEFGHSLGLGHSNSPDAIMAPIYRGYVPNARLHRDDIAGIQALYGVDSGMPEVEGTERPMARGKCGIANFVAAAQTRSEGSYLFNGTHAFKMDLHGLVDNPRPISAVFPGLPGALDAAFYHPPTGKTYFFKGSQYWRFSDFRLDAGYPRRIHAGFGAGLPNNIDAAFVWSGNGMTYFVKDDRYWRFNFRTASLDPGYPKALSVWNGIGTKVDAAFQFANSATYFFTDGEYRKFDDNRFTVVNTYPRSSTLWLKCDPAKLVASTTAATNVTDSASTNTTLSMDNDGDNGSGGSRNVLSTSAALLASAAIFLSSLNL